MASLGLDSQQLEYRDSCCSINFVNKAAKGSVCANIYRWDSSNLNHLHCGSASSLYRMVKKAYLEEQSRCRMYPLAKQWHLLVPQARRALWEHRCQWEFHDIVAYLQAYFRAAKNDGGQWLIEKAWPVSGTSISQYGLIGICSESITHC